MKKISLILLCAAAFHAATAQNNVGIGTTAPTDQLHTTGTVRFQYYGGSGNRLLLADDSGKLVIPRVYPTNATSITIADNGCAAGTGANSPIVISGAPASISSANLRVRIDIAHPAVGDLKIYLTAPTGQSICLSDRTGMAGANYTNTIFSDAASQSITAGTAPYTGTFKPRGSLAPGCTIAPNFSTLAGFGSGGMVNPNGTWTLKVYDSIAANTGTINSWSISFDATPPVNLTPYTANIIPKGDAIGNLVNGSIYDNGASIGIGTTAPNPSAALDVTATGKGILIPRMAFANRPASPIAGLMIYQTDNNPGFYYYNGVNWLSMSGTVNTISSFAGFINIIPASSTGYLFAGPTATVTITSSTQRVVASAAGVMALAAGTVTGSANVGMCYQSTVAGSPIINFVGGAYNNIPMTTDKRMYPAAASVTNLSPGTYNIGLGVYNGHTLAISNNDYVNGYVMVIN